MTHTEMEDALNNFTHRLSVVEQILPTLATKDDLLEGIADTKRHAQVLVESVRDDIRIAQRRWRQSSRRSMPTRRH